MTKNQRSTQTRFQPMGLLITLIGFLLILFSILLRIEPTLMTQRLSLQFHLTPDDLGNLMVKYQFALLLTLVFAGALIDEIGTRITLTCAVLLATLGHYWFSTATSLHELFLGRVAIGFAHPFIFIGVLKLGAEWLPKKYFALYAGLVFIILLLTPQAIMPLIQYSVTHTSWLTTFTVIHFIGALLAITLILTYRYTSQYSKSKWRDVVALLKNPSIWLICLISCFGWFENTFLLNWGGYYLYSTQHIPITFTTSMVNIAFLSFAIGAGLFGLLAVFTDKHYKLIASGYFLAACLFSAVILSSLIPLKETSYLLFLSVLCTGTAVICYAKMCEYATTATLGLAFGLIAFLTTSGNTLFAMLLIQFLGPITMVEPPSAWISTLFLIPLGLFLGGLIAIKLSKKLSKATRNLALRS